VEAVILSQNKKAAAVAETPSSEILQTHLGCRQSKKLPSAGDDRNQDSPACLGTIFEQHIQPVDAGEGVSPVNALPHGIDATI